MADKRALPRLAFNERVPVTVLTGFLGAGKTTLLNHLLRLDPARRVAVIVNEFGEVGVDGALIMSTDEQITELPDGCICCSVAVREDLINAFDQLRARDPLPTHIVIETTGLADPNPVVDTLYAPECRDWTRVDSVVTVLDMLNLEKLKQEETAIEQVRSANFIVLSKADLVGPEAVAAAAAWAHEMNPQARVLFNRPERNDLNILFDTGVFPAPTSDHVHDDTCEHDEDDPDHHHHPQVLRDSTGGMTSIAIELPRPVAPLALGRFLDQLPDSIYRMKGIIEMQNYNTPMYVQFVGGWRDIGAAPNPWPPGPRRGRMVFIGRNLNVEALRAGLESCMVAAPQASPTAS